MNQTIQKCRAVAVGLALLMAAGLSGSVLAQMGKAPDEPQVRSRAATGQTKPCIECHEGFYSITKTKHGVKGDPRTPAATGKSITGDPDDAMCGACHGDLTEHNKKPRTPGLVPVTFGKKAPTEPQNEACMACHETGSRIHWQGSKHERTKQTCASCHRVHASKDPVMVTETQASVCFECHQDRRAELHRMSTHPTKTGFFSCSSCHAAHGSTTRASLQKNSVNETCYTCHAQMRGPFLWEHRSAQDDCTNCHNPHGTTADFLLKTRAPFLCLSCHDPSSHPGNVPGIAGNVDMSKNRAGTTLSTTAPSDNNNTSGVVGKTQGLSCMNCHTDIHGSNNPMNSTRALRFWR